MNLIAQPPDIEEIYRVHKEYANLTAHLRILEHDLNLLEAEVKKKAPRDVYERLRQTDELRRQIIDIKNQISEKQAQIDAMKLHVDLYRAYAFANRV